MSMFMLFRACAFLPVRSKNAGAPLSLMVAFDMAVSVDAIDAASSFAATAPAFSLAACCFAAFAAWRFALASEGMTPANSYITQYCTHRHYHTGDPPLCAAICDSVLSASRAGSYGSTFLAPRSPER